jgi:hypothetical protein
MIAVAATPNVARLLLIVYGTVLVARLFAQAFESIVSVAGPKFPSPTCQSKGLNRDTVCVV